MDNFHRFKDFAEPDFCGEKIKLQDIVDHEILLLGFEIKQSKFPKEGNSDCLVMKIEFENKKRIVFTGAKRLRTLCEEYTSQMPFYTTIIRDGKRYILS